MLSSDWEFAQVTLNHRSLKHNKSAKCDFVGDILFVMYEHERRYVSMTAMRECCGASRRAPRCITFVFIFLLVVSSPFYSSALVSHALVKSYSELSGGLPRCASTCLAAKIPKLHHHSRRTFVQSLVADTLVPILSFLLAPSAANAGEIGAKITKAVTESELGIEVRRSVVRGAQLMVSYTGVG